MNVSFGCAEVTLQINLHRLIFFVKRLSFFLKRYFLVLRFFRVSDRKYLFPPPLGRLGAAFSDTKIGHLLPKLVSLSKHYFKKLFRLSKQNQRYCRYEPFF